MLGLPLEAAVRMASRHPAPGVRANLVAADDVLNVKATWIDGEVEYSQ